MTIFRGWSSALGADELPRDLKYPKLGLDLQGGTQVLLEADLPPDRELEAGDMDTAQLIVENRVNGLGVSEAVVQQQGGNRLIVELPGVDNPDQAVQTIPNPRVSSCLFRRAGPNELQEGMVINTTKVGPMRRRACRRKSKRVRLIRQR